MTLTKHDIEIFEKQLRDSLKEAETTLKKLDQELEFGSDTDHFEEEADEAEEFANQLSLRKALHDKINNISIALEKIKEGNYGVCERCGQQIETTVLHAAPESRFCKKCKKSL
jgi:DnaK suppressor protein